MEFNFTIDGSLDPVAAYAALLSTIIAFWELLKWKTRNAVTFRCHPNMELVPSTDKKTYIIADFTIRDKLRQLLQTLAFIIGPNGIIASSEKNGKTLLLGKTLFLAQYSLEQFGKA